MGCSLRPAEALGRWKNRYGVDEVATDGQPHGLADEVLVQACGDLADGSELLTTGGGEHADGVAVAGAVLAVRGVAEGLAAPVRTVANTTFGAAGAVVHGVEGMATGLGDLGALALRAGTDASLRDKLIEKAGDGVAGLIHGAEGAIADPHAALVKVEGAVQGAVKHFEDAGLKAQREGRGAEWVGEQVGGAAFQVVSTLQPYAKAGVVAKVAAGAAGAAATAGKVVQTVGKLGRGAEAAGDVAKVGGEVRVAGEVAKAGGAARAAGETPRVPVPKAPDDGLLGQDEHDGAAQRHDAQRLVRRVEHQGAGHADHLR